MIVIQKKEIIKIPSHSLCGSHSGIQGKFLSVRKSMGAVGQHIRLQPGSHFDLGPDSFLFRHYRGKILDILPYLGRHMVKSIAQLLHLVPCGEFYPAVQVSPVHLCHILRKGPRCIYHQGRINAPPVRMDTLDDALLHLHV